jgi:PTS system mannitol-specific IIC component
MTTDISHLKQLQGNSFRARVQRLGAHLAGMIMPNIGAFIAWGLITALFIPKGWLPNETLAGLVDPTIKYLLPILIGYTGGRMVHGQRGAVVGAVATMGAIVGSEVPMFLGAMIMGPLAAYLLKLWDDRIQPRVRSGFEMLVDNFSLGILGGGLALIGVWRLGWLVDRLTDAASSALQFLVNHSLLPLVSVIVEPAKALFLNNAVNHGIFDALGADQAKRAGQSILFMIETNPGPGLGILLAYWFFGPRRLRPSAPGAIIIQFFGGIHEIYFPYLLMKPRLILAATVGGMSGVATALVTHSGLVAPAAPGSIFAYLAVTPRGGHVSVLLCVAVAAVVTFFAAAALLKFGRDADVEEEAVLAGTPELSAAAAPAAGTQLPTNGAHPAISGSEVDKVVVACDAGMGSSVMLASQLRTRLKPYGVSVEHVAIADIPAGTRLVLTHADLAERARMTAPDAVVVEFRMFLGDPAFDRLEKAIKEGEEIRG